MDPWKALETPQVSVVCFYLDEFSLALYGRLSTGGDLFISLYGASRTLLSFLRHILRRIK